MFWGLTKWKNGFTCTKDSICCKDKVEEGADNFVDGQEGCNFEEGAYDFSGSVDRKPDWQTDFYQILDQSGRQCNYLPDCTFPEGKSCQRAAYNFWTEGLLLIGN